MFTQTEKGLRLLRPMGLRADRSKMTTEMVPQRISRRIVAENPDGTRFEALVATIQQRDAADRRATRWERAFFALAWIAGTGSVACVLAWMKGGW